MIGDSVTPSNFKSVSNIFHGAYFIDPDRLELIAPGTLILIDGVYSIPGPDRSAVRLPFTSNLSCPLKFSFPLIDFSEFSLVNEPINNAEP